MYAPAGFGIGLLLVAVGAVLVWGVTGEASGLDVDAIGVVLMIVGIVGFLLSLILWSTPWEGYRRRRYVEGEPRDARPRRRRIIEEEDVAPPY